jgi:hypothetical protein
MNRLLRSLLRLNTRASDEPNDSGNVVVSDSCQITPTHADHRRDEADAGMACSLAFGDLRPTETTVQPSLQSGGRGLEPGASIA